MNFKIMKSRIITVIAMVSLLIFFSGLSIGTVIKYDGIYYNTLSTGSLQEQREHVNSYLDYIGGKTDSREFFSNGLYSFTENERQYLGMVRERLALINIITVISAVISAVSIALLFIFERRGAFKILLKAFLWAGASGLVVVIAGLIWYAQNTEGILYFINSFAFAGMTDILGASSLPALFSVSFFGRIVRGIFTINGILIILTALLLWFLYEVTLPKEDKNEDYLYQ